MVDPQGKIRYKIAKEAIPATQKHIKELYKALQNNLYRTKGIR